MGKKSKKGKARGGKNQGSGRGGGVNRTKSTGDSSLAAQSVETSENEEVFTSDEINDVVTNTTTQGSEDGEEILQGATTIDSTESEDVKNGGTEQADEGPANATTTPNGNEDDKDEVTKEEEIPTTTTPANGETPATDVVEETLEVVDGNHPEDEEDIKEVEEEKTVKNDPVVATATATNDDAAEITNDKPPQQDDDFVIVDAAEAEGAPTDELATEAIESTTVDEPPVEEEEPVTHVGEVEEHPTIIPEPDDVEEEPTVPEATPIEEDKVTIDATEPTKDIENTTTTITQEEVEEHVEAPADTVIVVDEIVDTDPVVSEEPVAETVAEEPVVDEPIVDEIVADKPVSDEIVADEPVAEEIVADEPAVVEETVADEPVVEEIAAESEAATTPEIETTTEAEKSSEEKPINNSPEPTVSEAIAKVEEATETIVEAQAVPAIENSPVESKEIDSDSAPADLPVDEGSPEVASSNLEEPSIEEADVNPIPHVGTVVTSKTDDIVEETPIVVAETLEEEVLAPPTESDGDKIDAATESEPIAVDVEESFPEDEVPTDKVTTDEPTFNEPIDSETPVAAEEQESTEEFNNENAIVEEPSTYAPTTEVEETAVDNSAIETTVDETTSPAVKGAATESKSTAIDVTTEEKLGDVPVEEVAVEGSVEVAITESSAGIVVDTTNLTSPIPHVGTVDESKTFDFVNKDVPSNPADEKEATISATIAPDESVPFDEVKDSAAEPPAPVTPEPDSQIETPSLPVEAAAEKSSALPEKSDVELETAIDKSGVDDDNKENTISVEKTAQPVGLSKPDLIDQTKLGKSEAKADPKDLVVHSTDDVAIEISLVDEAAKHNARLSSVMSEESNADETNNKTIAAAATSSPSNGSVGMTSLLSEPARQEKEISQKDCDCACTIM